MSYEYNAIRELARQAANVSYDKLDFDGEKPNKLSKPVSHKVLNDVAWALREQRPFMLYDNGKNYAIIVPKTRQVACYVGGEQVTNNKFDEDRYFLGRIGMVLVIYDKFYLPEESKIILL